LGSDFHHGHEKTIWKKMHASQKDTHDQGDQMSLEICRPKMWPNTFLAKI
jgi:hypothetical protein